VQPSIAGLLRLSERCLSGLRGSASREFRERATDRDAQGTREAGKPLPWETVPGPDGISHRKSTGTDPREKQSPESHEELFVE